MAHFIFKNRPLTKKILDFQFCIANSVILLIQLKVYSDEFKKVPSTAGVS